MRFRALGLHFVSASPRNDDPLECTELAAIMFGLHQNMQMASESLALPLTQPALLSPRGIDSANAIAWHQKRLPAPCKIA